MAIRQIAGAPGNPENPEQVWFWGGIQLKSAPDFDGPEGRMAHLGVMTEDLDATLRTVYEWGAAELPQGRNWVRLPDGLQIEFIQAKGGAVKEILRINPW